MQAAGEATAFVFLAGGDGSDVATEVLLSRFDFLGHADEFGLQVANLADAPHRLLDGVKASPSQFGGLALQGLQGLNDLPNSEPERNQCEEERRDQDEGRRQCLAQKGVIYGFPGFLNHQRQANGLYRGVGNHVLASLNGKLEGATLTAQGVGYAGVLRQISFGARRARLVKELVLVVHEPGADLIA